ncbi:tail fiber assembly protein [Xenorhabdus sp. SGI246]|uniref:tail fiber assembly protein n=1 Tax=Xenorhabdus sp. SGI246 TaxID=3158263 RepID=UPI00349F845F
MPEGYTDLVPQTMFDNWDGKQWVTDIAAQQEYEVQQAEYEKRQLLNAATEKIAICQDAVDLDMATEEEKAALVVWKKYRVLLNRVDCSTAPDIAWPEPPK